MNSLDGVERLAVVEKELEHVRSELELLRQEVKQLVDAWTAATGVVKFVKLLSTVITLFTAIYFFVKHGFTASRAP